MPWSTWAVALSSGKYVCPSLALDSPHGSWLPKMSCGMLLGLGTMPNHRSYVREWEDWVQQDFSSPSESFIFEGGQVTASPLTSVLNEK